MYNSKDINELVDAFWKLGRHTNDYGKSLVSTFIMDNYKVLMSCIALHVRGGKWVWVEIDGRTYWTSMK